jgi:hypothetical protein
MSLVIGTVIFLACKVHFAVLVFTVFPLLHAEFKKRFVNVGLVNGVNHYGIWHKLMSCEVVLISKCCFVLPPPFTQR